MKSAFVAELQDGQMVVSFFLVREKEIRTSANSGKSWLRLALADRTGTIEAKMWDNFAELAQTFEREDVVRVRGRVKLYRGERELTVDQILLAVEADYALDDFLPHTKQDVQQLYSQLREEISAIRNPWLRRLLVSFVDDPEFVTKLKRAPAAMTMHHAYLGGLLEHIVSLCGLAKKVTQHYPEVDGELLLTGIVLHDIGKTEELCYKRAIGYTIEGQLLGHIVIGLGMVRQKIAAIADFPRSLAVLVEHLIVSHHGSYEFGSPKLPVVREAVLLNHLDDLDSKMAAMRETLSQADAEELWTERNAALRRNLLNTAAFVRSGDAVEGNVPAAPAAARAPQKPGGLFSGVAAATVASTAPAEQKGKG
ncbi:MAG: OB-fold nucleic acid binding domain-containing protein [Candidatus Acidiferrales bacterium]